MNIKHLLAVTTVALLPFTASAWEGEELDSGDSIEIESGNLVRPGQEIEVYNWDEGDYDYYDVERVDRYGSEVEVEVYDYQEGEYEILRMED
jgi:hypothetical protein